MIGFDIGGTKCAVSVGEYVSGKFEIKAKKAIPTDLSISAYKMIDKLCDMATELTDDYSNVGISCGGPLDSRRGIIMSPPNLKGWDNIEITDYIKKRLKSKNVGLQNDANACAVAEWKFGAGQECTNMIFLTFGTGLGAGLILDSKLYSGTNDMAGEVGHIRLSPFGPIGYGKSGSVEGFCSGGGIAQLGKTKATEALQCGKALSYCSSYDELDTITAKKIAEFANSGHDDAKEVYRICGKKLGEGLSILIDILNPEKIVIGSIFARAENLLAESMNEVLKRECLPASLGVCSVVPAKLGESIGDYAALAVAAMNT